jgi:hypothetical protein
MGCMGLNFGRILGGAGKKGEGGGGDSSHARFVVNDSSKIRLWHDM